MARGSARTLLFGLMLAVFLTLGTLILAFRQTPPIVVPVGEQDALVYRSTLR